MNEEDNIAKIIAELQRKHIMLKEWNVLKERLHNTPEDKIQKIRDGEVWWVGIGENVGAEIMGKSEYFSRPVLVYHKHSRYSFLGIPLTSKVHYGTWYVQFMFKGKLQTAVLSQATTYSTSRLYSKLGEVPDSDYAKVREGFHSLYCE